jgi:hypothetical protein
VLFSELAIYAFPPQKLQIRQTEEDEEEEEERSSARTASATLPFFCVDSAAVRRRSFLFVCLTA